jgi:peptidoglycan/xylan/chitin deacetylase (PgdA/CDA1 family)
MHVACSSFAAQLRAVAELYRIIPLQELKRILLEGEPLREPVAIVTFDDGYEDNFKNAFPVLAQENIPATFFLSFGFVDHRVPFWFDQLAEAAVAWDHQPAVRDTLRQQLPEEITRALDAPMSVRDRCRQAAADLKARTDAQRRSIMATLESVLDLGSQGGDAIPMTWEQARSMAHAGMSIGAHSVSHAILTAQPVAQAADEISASIDGITRRLGIPVDVFAYPNGDTNAQVSALVQNAGGTLAFTMEPRHNRPGDACLELGRYNISQETSRSAFREFSRSYFWCEITGFFDVVLRRNRRRLKRA